MEDRLMRCTSEPLVIIILGTWSRLREIPRGLCKRWAREKHVLGGLTGEGFSGLEAGRKSTEPFLLFDIQSPNIVATGFPRLTMYDLMPDGSTQEMILASNSVSGPKPSKLIQPKLSMDHNEDSLAEPFPGFRLRSPTNRGRRINGPGWRAPPLF